MLAMLVMLAGDDAGFAGEGFGEDAGDDAGFAGEVAGDAGWRC